MNWLHLLLLAILLSPVPGIAQDAYCYWIRLAGLYVQETPDFFAWGDYLPLIALEPGEFYSLLPGSETSAKLASRTDHSIDGHWYYVPAHLVDGGEMTLRFMLLDRDEDTDDDLVMPMRSHIVRLEQGFSRSGQMRLEISEVYVLDDLPTRSNELRFSFELRREPGACGLNGPEAAAANANHRNENRIHHLRSRVIHYLDYPVIAGREARLFVGDDSPDAETAYAIATRNLHELLALGREVERLRGVEGFDDLSYELGKLIAALKQRRLRLTRAQQEGDTTGKVSVTAPALASDPEWRELKSDAVIEPIPGRWQLP